MTDHATHDHSSHDHPPQDDLYAYALGALDPGEERAIAKHVPYCERCSTELRERINPAVGVLAESVEQRVPPPELREQLLSTVREEAEAKAGAEAPRERRPRGLGAFMLRPAVALTALAVLAAGATGYLLAGDEDQGAETVAFDSELPAAGASLEVQGDGATMDAWGMPKLAKGAVYQVWVKEGDAVSPSATFVARSDGSAMAALPEDLDSGDQVLVTKEPMAGRETPSSTPVLSASIN